MFVRELMTNEVVCCTPWDTARAAASLMKEHEVGAIPVVSELSDPLLEGIVTDRDLCCGVVADGKNADTVQLSELMTPVPVTCEPDYSIEECEELMQGKPGSQNAGCGQARTVRRHGDSSRSCASCSRRAGR